MVLQDFQRRRVGAVVDEGDGDVRACRERRRGLVEARRKVAGGRELGVERGGEEVLDVGLGAEDGDAGASGDVGSGAFLCRRSRDERSRRG